MQCDLCPSGTIAEGSGATECTACADGKFSSSDRLTCGTCPGGKFVNATLSECVSCSLGRYAPTAVNDNCILCGAGFATGAETEATACSSCAPGTYSAGKQQFCGTCPAGKQSGTRASACEPCEPGTFAEFNNSASCQACDAGTSTNGKNGSAVCESCPAGTYSVTRASTCFKCEPGFYTEVPGLSSCRACAAGRFAENNRTTNCTLCKPGQYQGAAGQPSCVDCEVGKAVAEKEAKFCVNCATGYKSLEGWSTCAICEAGYYWGIMIDPDQAVTDDGYGCETCPANANCYAGSFLGDLLPPVAKDGYWIDYEAAVDDPTLLREVYKCPRDTCLQPEVTSGTARRRLDGDVAQATTSLPAGTWSTEQGGGGVHSSSSSSSSAVVAGGSYSHGSGSPRPRRELNTNCLLLVNYNNPECQVDQTCEEGSYGPMCGACEAGWSYNAALRVCESCDTGAVYEQAFLVLGMGIVIAVVLWVIRTGEITLPKFMHRRCGRTKVIVPLVGIITSVDSGAIKLLWSTFQIVMSVSFNLSVSFPEPYNALSRYLSFVQFDFLSLECLEGGYYWGVYVSSAFPLFLSIVCWTIWFLRFSIDSVLMLFDPEEGSKEIAKLWAEHMHAFLLIIYIFVPPIANIQFKSLDCQKLKDGQSYLRVDTEVDCNSDEYKSFVGVVGALIAIYQSLPLLYIFMLCRVRDKLNPQGVNPRVALELRDNDESLNAVNFLFKDYKCNRWYFEIADMYRRIIFIGVIPLLNSDGATRAYAGCALALLSTVYFRELTPYRVEFTNFLAVVAQYVILLAFMAALMISTNSLDRFNISGFALGLIMSFTNALIVAMAVYIGWRRYQKEQRDRAEHAAKLIKIEWAVHFSANKFNTTFEYVVQRSIPASHQMVFYYCSMSQAQDIILSGAIPATSRHGGIVVNLMGPQVIKANDPSLSLGLSGPPKVMASREAVLCMALPHTMLHEYPKHLLEEEEELYPEAAGASSKGPGRRRSSTSKGAEKVVLPKEALASRADAAKNLRFIPGPILHAMAYYVAPEKAKISKKKRREMAKAKEKARKKADALAAAGNTAAAAEAKAAHDAKAAKEAAKRKEDDLAQRLRRAVVTLPSKVVVRAYQLVDQGTAPSIEPQELLRAPPPKMGPDNTPLPPIEVVQPKECSEYLAIMDEVRKECAQEGTVPLYHYTMVQIAPMIIRGGFRMSTQGQGDGGVYFSTLGPSSYELGADIYEENIIIDCFGKERLEEYRGKHKLDLLFVYGVHPSIVEQAPGGRENAKMVSKALFEDFANPSIDGNYFLRPDFIKAAILLDGTSGLPKGRDEALDGLDNEKVNDKLVQAQLNSTAASLHVHSDLAKDAREIYLEKASESTASPTAASSVVSVWSKLRSTGSKSFSDAPSSAQKKEGGPQDSSPGDGSAAAFDTKNTPGGRGSFQAAMIRAAKEEKARREREATGESDAADGRRGKNLLSVHEPAEGDESGEGGGADPEAATAGPESPPSPEEAPGVFASSSAALEAKI